MVIDVHVHTCALDPEHGFTSSRLLGSIAFRFMRWRLGIGRIDGTADQRLERRLHETIARTEKLDAAVILGFDAVHSGDGKLDQRNTHLYVKNDYAAELAGRYPNMLFGCSVHPYRKDAVAEIERCVKMGAVLMKWLPLTQCFNPADERCFPVYEALAAHKLPLLSHTGGENALPTLDKTVASPLLLEPALKRGVTVIAAHCGTRASPWDTDHLPDFMKLAHEYENLYGDTSALSLPTRSYAYRQIMDDAVVRRKLVHGSDWPILPMPPATMLGLVSACDLLLEMNWMRRDVLIKQCLGFDEQYWRRAGTILRIPDHARMAAPR